MGTWGPRGFENDAAMDFAGELTSRAAIAGRLAPVPTEPLDEIEADRAQAIIAAAECVAAMMGRPGADLPGPVADKLVAFGDADAALVENAREAVSRVLACSELLDLWAEADAEPWNAEITSLIDRLNPALPVTPSPRQANPDALQTCGFCDREIAGEQPVLVQMNQETDAINVLNQGFWCHLRCLNGKLHPRHLVQNWKFDPENL